eukprot:260782-Prymnesium_polylepis.1
MKITRVPSNTIEYRRVPSSTVEYRRVPSGTLSYPTWGRELISQVLFTPPTVSVPQVNLFASAEVTWGA